MACLGSGSGVKHSRMRRSEVCYDDEMGERLVQDLSRLCGRHLYFTISKKAHSSLGASAYSHHA
jgi:hypothetical protein